MRTFVLECQGQWRPDFTQARPLSGSFFAAAAMAGTHWACMKTASSILNATVMSCNAKQATWNQLGFVDISHPLTMPDRRWVKYAEIYNELAVVRSGHLSKSNARICLWRWSMPIDTPQIETNEPIKLCKSPPNLLASPGWSVQRVNLP